MKKTILTISVLLTVITLNAQKFEGLADTPPMGWNSWNKFAGNINEKLIREIADKWWKPDYGTPDMSTSTLTTAGTVPATKMALLPPILLGFPPE